MRRAEAVSAGRELARTMGHRAATEEELAAVGVLVLPTERDDWYVLVRSKRLAVEDAADVDRARPLLRWLDEAAATELAQRIRLHCAPTVAVEPSAAPERTAPPRFQTQILSQPLRGHRQRLVLDCLLDWRQEAWRVVPMTAGIATAVRREAVELLSPRAVRVAPDARRPTLLVALGEREPRRIVCAWDWQVVRDELNRRAIRL
jgi:hypothetical protein